MNTHSPGGVGAIAFTRSTEPFHEPPEHRSRLPLVIGVGVLLVFFVPLLVVIADNSGGSTSARGASDPATRPPFPRMPPLPPAGAPWPPPPGAPTPPVCTLEYRVDAQGRTTWTAMLTRAGRLDVEADVAGRIHRQSLRVPAAVEPLDLAAPLAQDHTLHATLHTTAPAAAPCLVGPQA